MKFGRILLQVSRPQSTESDIQFDVSHCQDGSHDITCHRKVHNIISFQCILLYCCIMYVCMLMCCACSTMRQLMIRLGLMDR